MTATSDSGAEGDAPGLAVAALPQFLILFVLKDLSKSCNIHLSFFSLTAAGHPAFFIKIAACIEFTSVNAISQLRGEV